jgi:hypothetical protein
MVWEHKHSPLKDLPSQSRDKQLLLAYLNHVPHSKFKLNKEN